MKKFLLLGLLALASCANYRTTSSPYVAKAGDIVRVKSLGSYTDFAVLGDTTHGRYKAIDLRTNSLALISKTNAHKIVR